MVLGLIKAILLIQIEVSTVHANGNLILMCVHLSGTVQRDHTGSRLSLN